jgi:hypothetical protein
MPLVLWCAMLRTRPTALLRVLLSRRLGSEEAQFMVELWDGYNAAYQRIFMETATSIVSTTVVARVVHSGGGVSGTTIALPITSGDFH